MAVLPISKERVFQKKLIVPGEHGAWLWMLVPFVAGAVLAARAGSAAPYPLAALALTGVGAVSTFLLRQPAAAWLRMRRQRSGRGDETMAAAWTLALSAVGAVCLAGLLALGRGALLWLLAPFAGVLVLYLLATRRGRAGIRAMSTELVGALGLALLAPAALIAVSGEARWQGWVLWALMAAQNGLGVFYARLRLADTHRQPANRPLVLWTHGAALAAAAAGVLAGWVPPAAVVPFAAFLARAAWAVREPRPAASVRRLGFTEGAVELASGLWIALSYWV